MLLTLRDGLPFVTVSVVHDGIETEVADVLVDTGSASTVLSIDVLGLRPRDTDRLRRMRGVGGFEVAFSRRMERVKVGDRHLDDFEVEIGAMDYGFGINGILGMDFLTRTGARLDLGRLTLEY